MYRRGNLNNLLRCIFVEFMLICVGQLMPVAWVLRCLPIAQCIYRDGSEAVSLTEVGKDDAGCEVCIQHCGRYDGHGVLIYKSWQQLLRSETEIKVSHKVRAHRGRC